MIGTTGVLTTDLETGDGPYRAVADRWQARRLCTDCWREPAVDDELGARCLRRLIREAEARAAHPSQ